MISGSSWRFLKIKTPSIPEGNWSMYFLKIRYPLLRSEFLSEADLTRVLGAMKEILGREEFLSKRYLKVRLGEFKNLPPLNIWSTSRVFALFLLANIAYTDSFFLPFWRLLFISSVPVFVFDRDRNPWALALFLFFGWYVCDIGTSI